MHNNINIYKHKQTYPYIHKQINLYILILFFTSILLSYLYSLLPFYSFILPLQSCTLTTYKGLIINILAIISLRRTFLYLHTFPYINIHVKKHIL